LKMTSGGPPMEHLTGCNREAAIEKMKFLDWIF